MRRAAQGGAAARPVHQADQGAQNDKKNQDAQVVAVRKGANHAVLQKDVFKRGDELHPREEAAAEQDADKQGGVDLLGNQGEHDGHDGGKERPGRLEKGVGPGLRVAHGEKCGEKDRDTQHDGRRPKRA